MTLRHTCFIAPLAFAAFLVPAAADASEKRDNLNFTGPLVTPAVNTLPAGMLNIEPYLIYANTRGVFDNGGSRHALRPHRRQWQVALPMIYGLGDTTAVQLTLSAARTSAGRAHTDGMRMGDAQIRIQQRLTGPGDDGTGWITSVSVAQRLALGPYHHLGTNPLNGMGSGVARTTLAYGAQKLFWLEEGRALRLRGQLAWSPNAARVRLRDASVYGTGYGFRGDAHHGQAWQASFAGEYALDPRWVIVGEMIFDRVGTIRIHGETQPGWKQRPGHSLSLAPAVEYHFNATLGLIAGVQFNVDGRNTARYVAPQAALNMVF